MKAFLNYGSEFEKTINDNGLIVHKVIWDWLFLDEFLKNLNPKNSLEIGVANGLTYSLIHKYSQQSLGIEINEELKYPKEWNILYKDSSKLDTDDLGNNFFNFIHIDGDHSYDSAVNDFKKCKSHINDDTIICVDDYSHIKGVLDATNHFLKENKNIFLKCHGVSQAFLVTKKSEKIFDEVISRFNKKTVKLLNLKTILHLDVWPKNSDTMVLEKLSNRSEFAYLKNKLQSYVKLV